MTISGVLNSAWNSLASISSADFASGLRLLLRHAWLICAPEMLTSDAGLYEVSVSDTALDTNLRRLPSIYASWG